MGKWIIQFIITIVISFCYSKNIFRDEEFHSKEFITKQDEELLTKEQLLEKTRILGLPGDLIKAGTSAVKLWNVGNKIFGNDEIGSGRVDGSGSGSGSGNSTRIETMQEKEARLKKIWLEIEEVSQITGNLIKVNAGQCKEYWYNSTCQSTNPRYFNYTGDSVWCTYSKQMRHLGDFVCVKCPKGTVGQETTCRPCDEGFYGVFFPQDEVQSIIERYYYQSKPNCVQAALYPSQISGYLSVDKKMLLTECQRGEFAQEKIFTSIQGRVVSSKQCVKCEPGKFVNILKTACVETCGYQQVADTRQKRTNTLGHCIGVGDCDLVSRDGLYCIDQCGYREYSPMFQKKCKLCPYNFPYPSVNRLQCVKSCGAGFAFDAVLGYCSALDNCSGFVGDHDDGQSCVASCSSVAKFRMTADGLRAAYGLFIDGSRKIASAKYQYCSFCPPSTPFVDSSNPSKCTGCASPLIMDFVLGKCVALSALESNGRVFSTDKLSVFPECPNGYFTQPNAYQGRGVCSACNSSQTPLSLPGVSFCCKSTEVFEDSGNGTWKCTPRTSCAGYISGKICKKTNCAGFDEYISNQIILSNGSNQMICTPCQNADNPFASSDNKNCSDQCNAGTHTALEKASDGLRCIPIADCTQYFLNGDQRNCVEMPKGCRVFPQRQAEKNNMTGAWIIRDEHIPSSVPVKVNNNKAIDCQVCPKEKKFIEDTPAGRICTVCTDAGKIRDLSTGMCVSSFDKISNPGSGAFMFNRKEFWSVKGLTVTLFKFGSDLLAESACQNLVNYNFPYISPVKGTSIYTCVRECPIDQILDQNLGLCIQSPEECSTILSVNSQICSQYACSPGEIVVTSMIGTSSKKQCQKCPIEKPMAGPNNTCIEPSCPVGQAISLSRTLCTDVCYNGYMSIDKKQCLQTCEALQLMDEQLRQCILPEKCFPKVIDWSQQACVPACASNFIPIKVVDPLTPTSQALVCVQCPLVSPYADKVNSNWQCVASCKNFDDVQKKCIVERSDCKTFVQEVSDGSFLCLKSCPAGFGKKLQNVYVDEEKLISSWTCQPCTGGRFLRNSFEISGSTQYDRNGNNYNDQDECVQSCSAYEFTDRSIMKCINEQTCNNAGKIADRVNFECVQECSLDLVHYAQGMPSSSGGKWRFTACLKRDQSSCYSDSKYKSAIVKDRETCYQNAIDIGSLIDRFNSTVYTRNDNGTVSKPAELINWSDCKGVVSFEGTECLMSCRLPWEVISYNQKGSFFQCTLCLRNIDERTRILSACVEKCNEGYVANVNLICMKQQDGSSMVIATNATNTQTNSTNTTTTNSTATASPSKFNNFDSEKSLDNNEGGENYSRNSEESQSLNNATSIIVIACFASALFNTLLIAVGYLIKMMWNKNQSKTTNSNRVRIFEKPQSKQHIAETDPEECATGGEA